MIAEALSVFVQLLILILIGFGPALWLLPVNGNRLARALATAPALGFSVSMILSFPLARFVGPIKMWAWPVAIGLIAISVGLVWLALKRTDYRSMLKAVRAREVWLEASIVLAGAAILVSPLVVKGIQYAAFRSNPSDAFTYITLAETLRTAGWKAMLDGALFNPVSNLEGMTRLAELSPTALYNARLMVVRPLCLNGMATMGWLAELAGVPTYRYYYAYNMLALSVSVPLALLLGRALKLTPVLRYLAAGATVLCFWTLFIVENDSSAQVLTIPFLLLMVVSWIWLEQAKGWARWRCCFVAALAGAVIACVYYPVLIVAIGGLGIYYLVGLIQRTYSIRDLLTPIALGAMLGLILTVTLQVDYVLRTVLTGADVAEEQKGFYPFGLELIRSDKFSAVWSLPESIFGPALQNAVLPTRIWTVPAELLGIFLTLSVVAGLLLVVRSSAPKAERIVYSVLITGGLLAGLFFLRDNHRSAAKAFTYVYPYLIFGAVISANYLNLLPMKFLRTIVASLLGLWLAIQCGLGAALPFIPGLGGSFKQSNYIKAEQYDLRPILSYLNDHPPSLLLVDIPRTKDWVFALYSMFAFSPYPVHFQSGLILDNSLKYQNLWLRDLSQTPDYVVVLKDVDYVAADALGTPVAETEELILYQVTAQSPEAFVARETMDRQQEQDKPVYPSQAAAQH